MKSFFFIDTLGFDVSGHKGSRVSSSMMTFQSCHMSI